MSIEQILPLVLAIILIFLIPIMSARAGMTYWEYVKHLLLGGREKFSAKKEQERIDSGRSRPRRRLFNSKKNELTELVSTLVIFARRHKVGVVFPATIEVNGELGSLLCFVVTKAHVYGINCFGYAGVIDGVRDDKVWTQRINGEEKEIDNPIKLNEHQSKLVKRAIDKSSIERVDVEVVAVFTNQDAIINARGVSREVMTTQKLIEHLKDVVSREEDIFDPSDMSRQLKTIVKS